MTRMQRISVVGPSGAGKSTLARALADHHHLAHVELDGLYHMSDWQPRPTDDFRAQVQQHAAADRWCIDGNYAIALDIVWERADTVVWLDLPRRTVLPALLGRTLWRGVNRTVLWNGNRESLLQLLDPRPEHNVFLWSATQFSSYRQRYQAASEDPRWQHLRFVRLRSRAAVTAWLQENTPTPP